VLALLNSALIHWPRCFTIMGDLSPLRAVGKTAPLISFAGETRYEGLDCEWTSDIARG